jgi:FkbM family methyltransferase
MDRVTLHKGNLKKWQETNLEYIRYRYPLKPNDLVVDLGAYVGEFATRIHDTYGCHVVCVEPTDNITGLQMKPGYTVINKAAATYNGIMRFNGLFYYTSAYEDGYGWRDYDCFDINELVSQEIALVKINVEGKEYELMEHMLKNGNQKWVRNFQIQFHYVEGMDAQKMYESVEKQLSVTHEKEWGLDFVWESWKRK